jgi:hypothetical protein
MPQAAYKRHWHVQVASHAQKYFLRDSAANQIRKRQRPSIHDIRSSSSVPSTPLEQEQLKCSLQRINKQSMELEMNAASDFHGVLSFLRTLHTFLWLADLRVPCALLKSVRDPRGVYYVLLCRL